MMKEEGIIRETWGGATNNVIGGITKKKNEEDKVESFVNSSDPINFDQKKVILQIYLINKIKGWKFKYSLYLLAVVVGFLSLNKNPHIWVSASYT